jgi:hypothetical protein
MKAPIRFLFILCLVISAAIPISAQRTPEESDFFLRSFGDNVNMRSEPSLTASVVKKLAIGEVFAAIEENVDSITVNGIREPFIKVQLEDGTQGYIWQGMVSTYAGEVSLFDLGSGILMAGKVDDPLSGEIELRFVQGGKLKKSWKQILPRGSDHFYLYDTESDRKIISHPATGFTPSMNLVGFNSNGCACGCWGSVHYYIWNGKVLTEAFQVNETTYNGGEDVFEIALPDRAGKNKVKVIETHKIQLYNEETGESLGEATTTKTSTYLWAGGVLKLQAEKTEEGGAQSNGDD